LNTPDPIIGRRVTFGPGQKSGQMIEPPEPTAFQQFLQWSPIRVHDPEEHTHSKNDQHSSRSSPCKRPALHHGGHSMLTAVNFNDKASLSACKICEIWADRQLPDKFEAV
jgi:hypothetical protein